MIYCFDIDGTVCHTEGEDYENAVPNWDVIERIKKLHDDGHTVHFMTARGSGTGKDWRTLTVEQLTEWGLEWERLSVGYKPPADVYVDDRAVNVRDW